MKQSTVILSLGALLAFSLPATAQSLPSWAAPSTPSGPPEMASAPPPPDAPPQVPIDGGLGLLALAGAGYAVKRLRDNRAS